MFEQKRGLRLSPRVVKLLEMGTIDIFSYPSSIFCERPIFFVFFNHLNKSNSFVLNIIVNFRFILFLFSLNDRLVKLLNAVVSLTNFKLAWEPSLAQSTHSYYRRLPALSRKLQF